MRRLSYANVVATNQMPTVLLGNESVIVPRKID
jgi:hypothetical protein